MSIRSRFYLSVSFVLACAFAAPAYAAEATVPDGVGLSVEDATRLLEGAGFEVSLSYDPSKPVGIVFSQNPGGLAKADTSNAVALSAGGATPKPGMGMGVDRPLPDTRPQDGPISGPSDDLGAPPAGGGTSVPNDDGGTNAGGMNAREPASTATAAPGASTLVYEGRAIPPGRMPNLSGPKLPSVLNRTTEQARDLLVRWKLRLEETLAVPELVGKVINQVPFAGSALAEGETVTIIVAVAKSGQSQVFVPQAQSRDWQAACSDLRRLGMMPSPHSVQSTAAQRGTVLRQSPQAGSLAARGGTVRLLVGRGPGAYSAKVVGSDTPARTDPQPSNPQPSNPQPSDPAPRDGPKPTPDDDGPPAGAGSAPIMPGADDAPVKREPAGPTDLPPTDLPPTELPPTKDEPTAPPPPEEVGSSTASALRAPTLVSPPAGESYPYKYGADFSWSAVTGATGYELELQEEQPSGAWQSVSTEKVSSSRHRPAKLDRGRYRWRVRAMVKGSPGTWSEFRRLYMY